uniref:Mitochondrial fission 1 protein n=1 Tax=Angiostrongylus cantonensis TaxID=6313 RepID=A0A0K0D634_ANGCA
MLMDVDNILDERVDPYDLEKVRDAYETQLRRGSPSAVATFDYAVALIRSTKQDVVEGTNMLEKLLHLEPDHLSKRDYVYYLAVANARLGNYDRALAYIDILLAAESHNRQATHLRKMIEKRMRRDGLFGLAVFGGGALLLTGVLAALFAAKK